MATGRRDGWVWPTRGGRQAGWLGVANWWRLAGGIAVCGMLPRDLQGAPPLPAVPHSMWPLAREVALLLLATNSSALRDALETPARRNQGGGESGGGGEEGLLLPATPRVGEGEAPASRHTACGGGRGSCFPPHRVWGRARLLLPATPR
eukprot:365232-Chlamydomonas_euryale.AAC.1